MTKVRYIIIEDEIYAMQRLQQLIQQMRPDWEAVFTAESISEASEYFAAGNNPDLCFMDVQLSDGNIFELFKKRKIDSPVIFTTAFDNYSLDAFSTNAVGYVLKPIAPDELRVAIEKYERSWGKQQGLHEVYTRMLDSVMEAAGRPVQTSQQAKRILTSVGNKYGYINIADIAWFVSEDKYVFAITSDGCKSLTTFGSLGEAEEAVGGMIFFVCREASCVRSTQSGISIDILRGG